MTRAAIRDEVWSIDPLDARELRSQSAVLAWIDSGAPLCRIEKPDVPPMHLVSYCVVIDGTSVLLVDHINAMLWLPTGGHVEPGEHPRDTAVREVREELGIDAEFLIDRPLFLTVTETVGLDRGHTDVSLWYLIKGDRTAPIAFDPSEFRSARWFRSEQVPLGRSDPEMSRFLEKLAQRR